MSASLQLRPLAYFQNKKLNPTRHKMCKAYSVELKLPCLAETISDEIWHVATGAGRNCYLFQREPLALKEYLQSESATHPTHQQEMAIYEQRTDLRAFMPKVHAHLQAEADDQNGCLQRLDVLVVEKAGSSLKWLLEESFSQCPYMTPSAAVEINCMLAGVVELGSNLQVCGVDWYADFHPGNVCRERIGAGYTWVDIEKVNPVSLSYAQALRQACKHLFMESLLTHVPLPIRSYWLQLKDKILEVTYSAEFEGSLGAHDKNGCQRRVCDVLKGCVPAMPLRPTCLETASIQQQQPEDVTRSTVSSASVHKASEPTAGGSEAIPQPPISFERWACSQQQTEDVACSRVAAASVLQSSEPTTSQNFIAELPSSSGCASRPQQESENAIGSSVTAAAVRNMQKRKAVSESGAFAGRLVLSPGAFLRISSDCFGVPGHEFVVSVDTAKRVQGHLHQCGGWEYDVCFAARPYF